ncbi:restriction endonuclease fold toxin 5 domain-containing protein [Xenorhabdus szentirmaii]|uniref:restriction endonuclease fold toxin 5 domain-containing protein n=1 Tax=Xenorhabdus szentirmaii TaxID=290112 RepID=UPI00198D87F7|nr:restriction endonuclease fold toxin 5 domain-containing protein [Xenorhabdus sp. CUL]MBD2794418.1 hypothetical protein [Xenorhabdus sp. CUL]
MPVPLFFAVPAIAAALEYTLTAMAGIAIGVGVGVGINEATKDKEDEKDNAKSDTEVITSSRTKCKECPAIGNVSPYWEVVSISAISTIYQIQICNSVYDAATNRIQVWNCKVVRFDGWKPEQCLFLEAKAKHKQFFKNGTPQGWWVGHESMQNQAQRQQNVCISFEGIPNSHWHFMEAEIAAYYSNVFSIHTNIKVFHTPFVE